MRDIAQPGFELRGLVLAGHRPRFLMEWGVTGLANQPAGPGRGTHLLKPNFPLGAAQFLGAPLFGVLSVLSVLKHQAAGEKPAFISERFCLSSKDLHDTRKERFPVAKSATLARYWYALRRPRRPQFRGRVDGKLSIWRTGEKPSRQEVIENSGRLSTVRLSAAQKNVPRGERRVSHRFTHED